MEVLVLFRKSFTIIYLKRNATQTSDIGQSNDEIVKNGFSALVLQWVFVINWHWCYSRLFDGRIMKVNPTSKTKIYKYANI